MESPVRKMQKRNDYNRHKLLRKIKRQRKVRAEQEAHAAEKELKKRLRWTPLKKYEGGKDGTMVYLDKNTGVYTSEDGTVLTEMPDDQGPFRRWTDASGRIYTLSQDIPTKNEQFTDATDQYNYNQGVKTLQQRWEREHPIGEWMRGFFGAAADIGSEFGGGYGAALADITHGDFGNAQKRWEQGLPALSMMAAMEGLPVEAMPYATATLSSLMGTHAATDMLMNGVNRNNAMEATFSALPIGVGAYKYFKPKYTPINAESVPESMRLPGEGTWEWADFEEVPLSTKKTYVKPQIRSIQQPKKINQDNIDLLQHKSHVPEEQYTGDMPKRTFKLENGQLVTVLDSSGKTIRVKPESNQILQKGWSISDIVDANGNINIGGAISALRVTMDMLQNTNALSNIRQSIIDETDGIVSRIIKDSIIPDPEREDVLLEQKNHSRSTYDSENHQYTQNTLRHLYNSAKSAQSAPVAKGSTIQQQVFNALSHDIGELVGQHKSDLHGKISEQILRQLFKDIPEEDLDVIAKHMDKDVIFSNNPVLQALKFADMASGVPYNEYIYNRPEQGFAKQNPVTNIGKLDPNIPTRDVIKNHINPVLRRYGYDTIDLNSSEQEAKQALQKIIDKHRTFVRGVNDPIKDSDLRYRKEVEEGVKKEKGTDEPSTREERLKYIATHITDRGRSHGEMGLGEYIDDLNLSDDTHAVYTSNSMDVASNYAGTEGEAISVKMPSVKNENYSLADMWAANEFKIQDIPLGSYGTAKVSDDYNYHIPYRLYTGRSLDSTVKQKYKDQIRQELKNNKQFQIALKELNNEDGLYSEPYMSSEKFDQVMPDGSVEQIPQIINEYAKREFYAIKDRVDKLNKYIQENSDQNFEIRPTKNMTWKTPNVIADTFARMNMLNSFVFTADDIVQHIIHNPNTNHFSSYGPRPVVLNKAAIAQRVALMMYNDPYISANTRNHLRKIYTELTQYPNHSDIKDGYVNELKRDMNWLVKYVEDYKKKGLKNYYFEEQKREIKRYRDSRKRKYIETKNNILREIMRKYYEKEFEELGIYPTYMTDESQTGPLIFTTERLRTNTSKATRTKRINRYNKLTHNTDGVSENLARINEYQHYIFPGLTDNKVLEFVGFEHIPNRHHKNSVHIGRSSDSFSRKIR